MGAGVWAPERPRGDRRGARTATRGLAPLPALAERRSPARRVDVVLLGATLALAGMGTLVVQSATRSMEGVDAGAFLVRQLGFLALGAVALVMKREVLIRS